ncbi:MAG: 3-isopropylmalate dehydratase small subunit [Deltaproteobacteria bacterium]|nr:3-isopropylmalate dehydratase small subunit [Candidatus Anaeroferrophillus wilburensis]MBN2888074.1 3-isopropylmalate dehydratase small subunit [Deltaproteobacteria bacterium]
MIYQGRAWKFGDDIDTDAIIPARYLNTSDPKELARHCMEDADPEFMDKMQSGDIIVAHKNFGCGSSREHAAIAIKAAGISCVIAGSFARIFYRNAFNTGLPILESDEVAAGVKSGDQLQINSADGSIENLTTGKIFQAKPIPSFMQELIDDGGLMAHVRKKQLQG